MLSMAALSASAQNKVVNMTSNDNFQFILEFPPERVGPSNIKSSSGQVGYKLNYYFGDKVLTEIALDIAQTTQNIINHN